MGFRIAEEIVNLNPRLVPVEGKTARGPRATGWPNFQERADDWLKENGGDLQFDDEGFDRYGIILDADMLVIDVDTHDPSKNGYAALQAIIDDGGPDLYNEAQLVVESPSGGVHLYFSKEEGLKFPKSVDFYAGLDFLSKGTCVIGAGSSHWRDGGEYKVIRSGEITEVDPYLIEMLTPVSEQTPALYETTRARTGTSPVDDFNTNPQGVEEVRKLLEQRGYVFTRKTDHYSFVRPGKNDFTFSISGTLGRKNSHGNYFVKNFSTSDSIFGAESYNVSEALRLIVGCAREDLPRLLRDKGFGTSEPSLADDPRFAELLGKTKKLPEVERSGEQIERQCPTVDFDELQEMTAGGQRRPYVIDGLLRRGEVCNIIASPKVGKSFLVYNMAFAMSCGKDFLGYQSAENLKVLICDNELHPEELAWRTKQVANGLGVNPGKNLQFTCLRGADIDVDALDSKLDEIGASNFDIIVIDALYRVLPKSASENSNSDMTQVYNKLDSIARKNECAVVCIHHSSKGNQGDKGVTDVGAGAGAVSRAADTHLVIREHVDKGLCVIDAVTRSGKSPEPVVAKLEWPIWKVVKGVEPTLKTFENARDKMHADKKKEADGREDEVVEYMLKWQAENEGQTLNSAQLHEALKMSTWGAEKTFKKHLKAMAQSGRLKELPKATGSLALRYFAN